MKNINYISAGAGSGKTYTLTHRLADHIIKGDVQPEEVILTTFTDKAATEFRERAKAALNEKHRFDEAGRLDLAEIGTVHSIAYKMVSKYWYILGLSPQLKVMDENDVNFFISQSLADLPTDEEIRFLNDFRQVVQQLVGHLAEVNDEVQRVLYLVGNTCTEQSQRCQLLLFFQFLFKVIHLLLHSRISFEELVM